MLLAEKQWLFTVSVCNLIHVLPAVWSFTHAGDFKIVALIGIKQVIIPVMCTKPRKQIMKRTCKIKRTSDVRARARERERERKREVR